MSTKLKLSELVDLKEAILHLPTKEKDKLLIRLISKDQMLIKQLHFLLLEDENDLWSRHKELEDEIKAHFIQLHSTCSRKNSSAVFQILLVNLREISGKINEHASITKSKESELKLRLKVFRWSIEYFPDLYSGDHYSKYSAKFYEYQKGRLKLLFGLYAKLHEDLQYEFRDDLEYVISYIQDKTEFYTILKEYPSLG